MADNEELKNMVLSFRVSELQMLLGFAGRNKTGRKTELQSRALDLLKLRSSPVTMKIKELYKTIHREMTMQQQQQTASQHPQQVVPALAHHGHHSMTHHSTAHHHHQQQQQQQHLSRISYHPPTYSSQQMDRNMQSRGSVYAPGLYHQFPPKAPAAPSVQYPIHPDVRLKKLPFYDHITELLKPSTLLPQGPGRYQESNFVFHLTPQQATDVASCRDLLPGSKVDYVIQVQMRFCLLETSCEQDDAFPPGICLKVNGKICPLPNPIPTNKAGVEPKRPSRPVNITPLVKLCPAMANQVSVSWAPEFNRNYAACIYLVRKLSSGDLLQRLKSRGLRHADYTRGLIKEKLNEEADSEIATTSLKASLVCPLGKMRMTTPCRASTCYHLQCFDASLYLQMNEKKPMWICPVCDKQALYDNLVIDGYFQEVLLSGKLPSDSNDVQLHGDGSWSSSVVKKDPSMVVPCTTVKAEPHIETVSDESETPVVLAKEVKKQPIVVDLTLSDSDEGDDETEKMAVTNIPDSSIQELAAHSIPSTGTPLNSSGSNSSRTHSERRGGGSGSQGLGSHHAGRGGINNHHSGGPSSVSSSGYVSPSIITLDSPSPPSTPNPQASTAPSVPIPVFPNSSLAPYSSALPPQTSPSLSTSSSSSSSSSPGSYASLRPRRVRNFSRNVIFSSSSSSSSSASASPLPSPPLEALGPYPSCPPTQQPMSQPQPQQHQQYQPQQIMSQPALSQQTMPTLSQQTMPQQTLSQQSMAQHIVPQQSMALQQQQSSVQMQGQQAMSSTSPLLDLYVPVLPPYLDLDSDSNGSHSGGTNNLFPRF